MRKNFIGSRYGRLLVLANAPEIHKYNQRLFCACDCGTMKVFEALSLVAGTSKSCGCLKAELSKQPLTHGLTYSYEYAIWTGMKNRCKRRKGYADKGVKVCDRWESSFENFLADMGFAPTPEHSIDRIDNSLGYWPSNCRWANDFEQAQNKSSNRHLAFNGEILPMSEMARRHGLQPCTLWARLKSGKSVEEALTAPLRKISRRR